MAWGGAASARSICDMGGGGGGADNEGPMPHWRFGCPPLRRRGGRGRRKTLGSRALDGDEPNSKKRGRRADSGQRLSCVSVRRTSPLGDRSPKLLPRTPFRSRKLLQERRVADRSERSVPLPKAE